jgi:hypothetical protein
MNLNDEEKALFHMIASYSWWNADDLLECYARDSDQEGEAFRRALEDLYNKLTGKELL